MKSNMSFFIEALDELPTRQVKSLITKIALEPQSYPENEHNFSYIISSK